MDNERGTSHVVAMQDYNSYLLRQGRLATTIAYFGMFLPPIFLMLFFKINFVWEYFSLAAAPLLAITLSGIPGPFYLYPTLGVPGVFMSYIAGDVYNIRIPCSLAAQEAGAAEVGTDEASIFSSLGIGVSVIVKIVIVVFGLTLLFAVLSSLPRMVTTKLTMMVPALIGACFTRYCLMKPKATPVVLAICILIYILERMKILNPNFTTIIQVVVAVGAVYLLFKKKVLD